MPWCVTVLWRSLCVPAAAVWEWSLYIVLNHAAPCSNSSFEASESAFFPPSPFCSLCSTRVGTGHCLRNTHLLFNSLFPSDFRGCEVAEWHPAAVLWSPLSNCLLLKKLLWRVFLMYSSCQKSLSIKLTAVNRIWMKIFLFLFCWLAFLSI